jgi:hypothetical protein
MMSFFSLPDVLCVEVMFKWCDVKGIGNLDSAACNSEFRSGFLTNFSGNSLSVSIKMNDCFMNWIMLRSVKPTSFVIYDSRVFASWKDAINWSEILEVTFLERDKRSFQTTNLLEIVNKCEKLISIKDECRVNVKLNTDAMLVHLTKKCHELRMLEIHCYFPDVSKAIVLGLVKGNPNLEKIDIAFVGMDERLFSSDFLPSLVTSCPNLISLSLDQVCEINLGVMTKILVGDFQQYDSRYDKFGLYCLNYLDDKERVVFTSNNGVRSILFDNVTGQFSVSDTDMLEFFTRVVNLHNVTMLNWVDASDDMLVMLARASPDLRSLQFGDYGYFPDFGDDDDDRSYVGLQRVLEACRELRDLSLEFITTSLCEQILTVLTTPNTVTGLSLTHEDSQTAVFSGFLVDILQANLQLTTLRTYNWPLEEITCVKDYLLETGRVLEFVTAHIDEDNS